GDARDALHRPLLAEPVLYFLPARQHRDPRRFEAGPGDVAGGHRARLAGDRLPAAQRAPRAPTPTSAGRSALDRGRSGELSGAFAAFAALQQELEESLGLKFCLLDDRLDLALQALAIFGREHLGGMDDDRNPADGLGAAQRRD